MVDEQPKRSTGVPWYSTAIVVFVLLIVSAWPLLLVAEEVWWWMRPRAKTTGSVAAVFVFPGKPGGGWWDGPQVMLRVGFEPQGAAWYGQHVIPEVYVPFEAPPRYRKGDAVEIEYIKDSPYEIRILRVLRPAPVANAAPSPKE